MTKSRLLLCLSLMLLLMPSNLFSQFQKQGITINTNLGDDYIAQIADGEGWSTSITFVNLSDETAFFDLLFYGDDGNPVQLPIIGIGSFDGLTGQIPINGSVTVKTAGTSSPVKQGWAEIVTSQNVGGMAVFSFSRPGFQDSEAVVPFMSTFDQKQRLPFDHTNGFFTGVALANTSPFDSVVVFITFRDENGNFIQADSFNLQPREHTAFLFADRYPQIQDRIGTAEFVTNTDLGGLALLGLRFNPDGPFTTVFPFSCGFLCD